MATDEELVRERVMRELGITALEEQRATADTCRREDMAQEIVQARYVELGQRHIEALVQLELEVGGLKGDPGQSEYVLGVIAALEILRGQP
jgi:hypothetical protein